MDNAKTLIESLLGYGPAVVMPLIIFLLALLVGMRPGKAISSGLRYGVAFTGIIMVIVFLLTEIGPAGKALVDRTGLEFRAYDTGWPPMAAITWAWAPTVLMFPLQIAINLIMLSLRWTDTLNVDMWNVFHKGTIAYFIVFFTGNIALGFIVAAIWVVMELKSADWTKEQVYNLTRVPGVNSPHNMFLDFIWLSPIMWLLDKIPALDRIQTKPEDLQRKIGVFGENHVIGFILGVLLGLFAGYDTAGTLKLGITAATSLLLFPVVARLFMEALAPFSEAVGDYMRKRFPGREIYIGLDWPILGGVTSIYSAAILLAPCLLILAVILPGNYVLPFGSIIFLGATIVTATLAQGDLVKTFILALVFSVVAFYTAMFFAEPITSLALSTGAFALPEGVTLITALEAGNGVPERVALIEIIRIFDGRVFPGIIYLVGLVPLYIFYRRYMKVREAKAAAESGGIRAASGWA